MLLALALSATGVTPAATANATSITVTTVPRRRLHAPPAALEHFGVYWVHTPKSGSSFGLAVLQACDPVTFRAMRARPTNPKLDSVTSPHFSGFCNDWLTKLVVGEVPPHFLDVCHLIQTGVGHFRFAPQLSEQKAVIMLRQPAGRIVSSFLDWPSHHEGMDAGSWDGLVKAITAASEKADPGRHDRHPRTGKVKPWVSSVATAAVYMGHPGMKGCVVKTLTGSNCYEVHPRRA